MGMIYGPTGYMLRALQFIFAAIILGLFSDLIANKVAGGSNSQVNYSEFLAVFSLFSLIVWAAGIFSPLGHPFIQLGLDVLNLLFTLAGGIAMAVVLRVHSCGNQDYINSNKVINGSSHRCREAQAGTAFIWFLFAAYLASTLTSAMTAFSSADAPSRRRRGGAQPQMAQA
ncbi:hypothetical protein YB2330_005054 [Saitoella coloradoensis]